MLGKTISHYRIVEKLGESGMGVVYKSEDTKLKRTVALKFLPPYLTDEPEATERFIQEAQTASALDHNNICTIHEIGETSEGQMYIVMTYYEGETIKKKIKHGSLELEHILNYIIQVAEGLRKVHVNGIVHRDIKSTNVMITRDGIAKILDFGLAKLAGRTGITKTGSTLGTVAYMSPEQAQGLKIDHRTDIWSLGVVMYEILTGQLPFKGDNDQVIIYSIVNEDYTPITEIRSDVWIELEQVVANAMQKDCSDRYQSMDEFLIDLKSINKKLHSSQLEVVIVRKTTLPSIAVLPFLDMSPQKDQDYFCEGIAEELINALTKIEKLRVASRTSSFQFKGKSHHVHQIGKELNVKTVLEGSVRKAGNKLRITAQLVNANNGYHLWAEKYDRDMEDIFAIQDEISLAIVDKLKVELLGDEKARLVKRYTENQEAHNLYLKGLYFWNRQHEYGYLKSMEYFQQAIEQDALYALPYTGIADAFTLLGLYGFLPPREAYVKARSAAIRALDIDDTLAEAHLSMALIHFWLDWNWFYADKEFK